MFWSQSIAFLLMYVFYVFAVVLVWLGILSLRNGIHFARYVRSRLAKSLPEFTPFASIIVPFRGMDQSMHENLHPLFLQNYAAYEIIFVTDDPQDASLKLIEEMRVFRSDALYPQTRIVIDGNAVDSGQKVHNLRIATGEISAASEVLVFVDTDARPSENWLRSLVAPLRDKQIGATTGYRWFIPERGGLVSHLRSVWNASIASALGEDTKKNFCWGGSTAIHRRTFDRLNVRERWRGTVSDDFTLTRVLHEAELPIEFVPQCLTPSFEDCSFGELLEFTTRQLKITRAYAAHLWRAVLIGSLLFVLGFFGGIVLVISRAISSLSYALPLAFLLVILALGALKSYVRLKAVRLVIPDPRLHSWTTTLAQTTLWPFASALFLYNAIRAAVSRRINWRGIVYELKSPTETVIISRDHK